jgi:hypothetical protein
MLGGEFHPSASYGAVAYQSALRPPSIPPGVPVPMHGPPSQPVPQLSPPSASFLRATSPSAHYSVQVAPMPSLVSFAQQALPPQPAPQPAPSTMMTTGGGWWGWVVGGVLAVGLGIGGAVWYAGRGPAPVTTAPVATTPVTTAPVATAPAAPAVASKRVAVRFDSLPSAGVFAEGHSAELCRTPCSFDVDLGDGGPADQRAFVVRLDGYEDKQIVVDLTAAHPEANVTLERVAVAATPTPQPLAHPGRPAHPGHGKKEPAGAADEAKPEAKPEAKDTPPAKQPAGDGEAIDQTETMDPFQKK